MYLRTLESASVLLWKFDIFQKDLDFFTIEDGTNRLSQNIYMELTTVCCIISWKRANLKMKVVWNQWVLLTIQCMKYSFLLKRLKFYYSVLFMWHWLINVSWGSVVGVVRLWVEQLRICASVYGWNMISFSSLKCPDQLRGPPSLLVSGCWVLPADGGWPECEADCLPPSSAKV
jgi:hypothetical protein